VSSAPRGIWRDDDEFLPTGHRERSAPGAPARSPHRCGAAAPAVRSCSSHCPFGGPCHAPPTPDGSSGRGG
jgi:hypothetical protein